MRRLKAEDLVGKTIKDADCGTLNVTVLTFSDDTQLAIWCEPGLSTGAGEIWGFFVQDYKGEKCSS